MPTLRQRKGAAAATSHSDANPTETETETEFEGGNDSTGISNASSSTSVTAAAAPAKKSDFGVRAIWTLIMVAGFLLLVAAGHVYLVLLVLFLSTGFFREILELKKRREKDSQLPLFFRVINWYFLLVTVYWMYGRWLKGHFAALTIEHPILQFVFQHQPFKSFAMYTLGFVGFVATLQKGFYKYQFGLFAWTHMTLLFIIVQASMMSVNIMDGMMWFFLPCGLVIWNDVFAYIFGRAFGRTPLIKISPKKTWEGFIGAGITTVMWGFVCSYFLTKFEWFYCPQPKIIFEPFADLHCDLPEAIAPRLYQWPPPLVALGMPSTFEASPLVIHSFTLSVFASIIAPFGGFFASGFKRAFKIKDFAETIPGHGGIADRMDCQIIMGVFVYVYRYTFFPAVTALTVPNLLSKIAFLPQEQQLELFETLRDALVARDLISR